MLNLFYDLFKTTHLYRTRALVVGSASAHTKKALKFKGFHLLIRFNQTIFAIFTFVDNIRPI